MWDEYCDICGEPLDESGYCPACMEEDYEFDDRNVYEEYPEDEWLDEDYYG